MVHCCILAESADRRQYAKCIRSQENNYLGNAAATRDLGVGNVINRIADTGILSQAAIIKIKLSGLVIKNNVLNQGTETDRIVDVRLILCGKIDALRIAAALEVKDAFR